MYIAGTRPIPPREPDEPLTPERIKNLQEELQTLRGSVAFYKAQLEAAREEARTLCDDFGDLAWHESERLDHVLKYHLGRHLYNDAEHLPGSHRCALCREHSTQIVFGEGQLLIEKTGDEGEAWVCQACIDKAHAEFYGEGE